MRGLARFVRLAEALTRGIGRAAAWLVFLTVLVCAGVAILRYGLGFGRIWLQELYVAAFGVGFMLVAPWAYAEDAHIRIDILTGRWSERRRAVVEILGGVVFLIPWLLFVLWASWPFVRLSWMVHEPSPQAGGLPGYYLIKSVIPLFALLMLLQGLASIARSVLVLARRSHLLPPVTHRTTVVE